MAKPKSRKIRPTNRLAGEALRALRKSAGLTQKRLARRLARAAPGRKGDSTAISKLETGRRPLTWELIVDLCQAMDDTPLDSFLAEYETAKAREERRTARLPATPPRGGMARGD